MRLLLVEDDPVLARQLARCLDVAGYPVDHVCTGADATRATDSAWYDLVILDRRLPDGDSVTRIAAWRRRRPGLRVLVLTALDGTRDKVDGLDAGADDYLTKPVDSDELLARVRAALRRPGATTQPSVVCGNLGYDPNHRTFAVAGAPFVLKRGEALILEALMMRARRVVQRHSFMNLLYRFDHDVQSNTLDAQVSRLRTRLAEAGASVRIHAVRGVGYVIDEVPTE